MQRATCSKDAQLRDEAGGKSWTSGLWGFYPDVWELHGHTGTKSTPASQVLGERAWPTKGHSTTFSLVRHQTLYHLPTWHNCQRHMSQAAAMRLPPRKQVAETSTPETWV